MGALVVLLPPVGLWSGRIGQPMAEVGAGHHVWSMAALVVGIVARTRTVVAQVPHPY